MPQKIEAGDNEKVAEVMLQHVPDPVDLVAGGEPLVDHRTQASDAFDGHPNRRQGKLEEPGRRFGIVREDKHADQQRDQKIP